MTNKYRVQVIVEFTYDADNVDDYPLYVHQDARSDKERIENMVRYDLSECPEVIYLELPTDETVVVLDNDK